MRELVEIAFARVGLDWQKYAKVDPALLRPAEVDHLLGDASKARTILGWTPQVDFKQLVEMMVDADLQRLSAASSQTRVSCWPVTNPILISRENFRTWKCAGVPGCRTVREVVVRHIGASTPAAKRGPSVVHARVAAVVRRQRACEISGQAVQDGGPGFVKRTEPLRFPCE